MNMIWWSNNLFLTNKRSLSAAAAAQGIASGAGAMFGNGGDTGVTSSRNQRMAG